MELTMSHKSTTPLQRVWRWVKNRLATTPYEQYRAFLPDYYDRVVTDTFRRSRISCLLSRTPYRYCHFNDPASAINWIMIRARKLRPGVCERNVSDYAKLSAIYGCADKVGAFIDGRFYTYSELHAWCRSGYQPEVPLF